MPFPRISYVPDVEPAVLLNQISPDFVLNVSSERSDDFLALSKYFGSSSHQIGDFSESQIVQTPAKPPS